MKNGTQALIDALETGMFGDVKATQYGKLKKFLYKVGIKAAANPLELTLQGIAAQIKAIHSTKLTLSEPIGYGGAPSQATVKDEQ